MTPDTGKGARGMKMNTRDVRVLRAILVLMGLSVPILPRLVAPALGGGPYVDTLGRVFESPAAAVFLFLWTAVPFAALAAMLRPGRDGPHRQWTAVIGTALVILVVGYVMHMPTPRGAGVNMGVAIYPILAGAIIAAASYLAPRLQARAQ